MNASIIHFIKVELKGLVWQALGVRASRKLPKALPISPPLKRIIEDVYRGDLIVYFGVYTRVIIKALIDDILSRNWYLQRLIYP